MFSSAISFQSYADKQHLPPLQLVDMAPAQYGEYCKPKYDQLLSSLGLDKNYDRASGNYVYYRRGKSKGGGVVKILDLIGGFGSSLFGHHHPEISAHYIKSLRRNTAVFTQCAVRGESARLAGDFNRLLPGSGKYICQLTNSGAEAIEATLKHAYKVRLDEIRRVYERISRRINEFYHRIDRGEIEARLPGEFKDLTGFRNTVDEANLTQLEHFQNHPVVCAFKGSFHGKTTSALKLTFNKSYRESFEGLSAIQSVFIEIDRPQRLQEIVAEHQVSFLYPEIEDGQVRLQRCSMTAVMGFIMEIVLGEGGIRVVPETTLRALAESHARLKIPYIIDEIQTGCGRAGAIAAYLNTPLAAIEPEYLVFGKALGGGMVKIAASLIHEKVYDPDFGLLHTSTFAEDDLSSAVGRKVLDMLSRNNNHTLHDVQQKGRLILQKLALLQAKYPDIIKEVRGSGLMIGLEFTQLKKFGAFFRYAGQKGFLSLLVASYLLNRHNIRLIAPISTLFKGNPGKDRPAVLRIQPPVTLTETEIERLIAALDDVLNIISHNNEYFLVAHLIDQSPEAAQLYAIPVIPAAAPPHPEYHARVGFVVHVTRLEYLMEYYFPSFKHYPWDRKRFIRWWNGLSRFLEPEVVHRTCVASEGFVVEANIVFVPYLAETMVKTYLRGKEPDSPRAARLELQEMQDKIQDAVLVARDQGDERIPTSIVGLGAFTSIVTQNGTTLNDHEIPISTGNSYTTGLMLQGILKSAALKNIHLESAEAAVVGAAGNIGSTLAALLCFHPGRVHLIGRHNAYSRIRLIKAQKNCLVNVLAEARSQLAAGKLPTNVAFAGAAGTMYADLILPAIHRYWPDQVDAQKALSALKNGSDCLSVLDLDNDERLASYFNDCRRSPVMISNLDALPQCKVVTVATNSTDAKLVGPENVKKGAIVASASLPSNLSSKFEHHLDDYFVFDSGLARLPEGNAVNFVGMPGGGSVFGCLAETLVLGFEGTNRSFSKGDLTLAQVNCMLEMADTYGFSLGAFQLNEVTVPVQNKKTISGEASC